MRSFVFVLSVILAFIASAFAQEISPCPKVEITGPSSKVNPGDTMTFIVNIFDNAEKYKFDWSVDIGQIIEGQGTPNIVVSAAGLEDAQVTATVKITGLMKNCDSQASKIRKVRAGSDPILMDEYEKISFAKEKSRLNKIAEEFKNLNNVKVIFIFRKREKDSYKAFQIRKSNIRKYLTETLKIPVEKIEFIFGGSEVYKTKIYIAPDDTSDQ